MKISFQLESNVGVLEIPNVIQFTKAKVTKFKFVHANLNVKSILLDILGLDQNVFYNTGNKYLQYFFMGPYIANTNLFFNSNTETWDYCSHISQKLNSIKYRLLDETGALIPLVPDFDIQLEIEFI